MSAMTVAKDKNVLRESLARIDMQLFKKGMYQQVLNKTVKPAIHDEDDKQSKGSVVRPSKIALAYASQRTTATSYRKDVASSIDTQAMRTVEKQPEPYFSTIKTDCPTTSSLVYERNQETIQQDRKRKSDKENVSPTILSSDSGSDLKSQYAFLRNQQVELGSSLKDMQGKLSSVISQVNAINEALSKKDSSSDVDTLAKQIEEKVMKTAEAKLHSLMKDYEAKMHQLTSDKQTNSEGGNQAKQHIDNAIETLQTPFDTKMNEVNERIDQINPQTSSTNLVPFLPKETNDAVSDLFEQAATLQAQIAQIKTNQSLISSNLAEITELSINNNQSLSHHQAKVSEIKEDLQLHKAFFEQFKQEQIRLNDMYEKTLTSLITQVLSLQSDTKAVLDDCDRIEDNFEISQRNFDQLKPVAEGHTQMKKDFAVYAEIIKALTQNYQEIKGEVNNNFDALSQWQTELVENVTKAVNELKLDYNGKFRQSHAMIGTYTDKEGSVNDKAKERMSELKVIQSASDRKYVLKEELLQLKEQIEKIEKQIKENANKQQSFLPKTDLSPLPLVDIVDLTNKQQQPQDINSNNLNNDVQSPPYSKDQEWDFNF